MSKAIDKAIEKCNSLKLMICEEKIISDYELNIIHKLGDIYAILRDISQSSESEGVEVDITMVVNKCDYICINDNTYFICPSCKRSVGNQDETCERKGCGVKLIWDYNETIVNIEPTLKGECTVEFVGIDKDKVDWFKSDDKDPEYYEFQAIENIARNDITDQFELIDQTKGEIKYVGKSPISARIEFNGGRIEFINASEITIDKDMSKVTIVVDGTSDELIITDAKIVVEP